LDADVRRFDMGSEAFTSPGWVGVRNTFRYSGSQGHWLHWHLIVPWLYSSYFPPGHTGKGALRVALNLRLLGADAGWLRAAYETWFAFSSDALYPLMQRRNFGCFSILGDGRWGPLRSRAALGHYHEIVGLGEDPDLARWPSSASADLRLGAIVAPGWQPYLDGGVTLIDDNSSWGRVALGAAWSWTEHWLVELELERAFGDDPALHDYRLGLRFWRDFGALVETSEGEEGEQDAGPGGQEGGAP
jgi:hypothetical protein